MKKIISVAAFFCILLSNKSNAQWVQQAVPTGYHLYSVFFTNPSTGYIGAQANILKTTNGGTSWSILPFTGADSLTLKTSAYYSIYFISTMGWAAGRNILTNNEIIIRTLDGGLTWNIVQVGPFGSQWNSIWFTSVNVGFVAGNGGRIFCTQDGGITWIPLVSGVTTNLNSIYFTNSLTGYVVGPNKILKTIDGGDNWTLQTSPISLNSVFFSTAYTGYAVGIGGAVIKTTDAGANWNVQNTFVPDELTSVFFTDSTTGYACGYYKILKTINGGNLWEKQPYTPNAILTEIFFPTAQNGFATGLNGVLEKTGNAGGMTAPIAHFTIANTSICADSSIYFMNDGPAGYTYRWYDNGVLFSTSHNSSAILAASTTHTIKLVATHNGFSDSMSVSVTSPGSLAINFTTFTTYPATCPHDANYVNVMYSALGVTYQLRNGLTNLGGPVNGTGSILSLYIGTSLTDTTILNVLASKTNSCGTHTVIVYDTVAVVPYSSPATVLTVTDDSICEGDTTIFILHSTQAGYTYVLNNSTASIGTYPGTGGDITIPLVNLANTTTFSVTATNPLGCFHYLPGSVTVFVHHLTVDFTRSDSTIFVGDTMTFVNLSNADTYSWYFGYGASMDSSNLPTPPALSYSFPGSASILLIGNYNDGCVDSTRKEMSIYNHTSPSGSFCFSGFANDYEKALDTHVDRYGNIYITGYFGQSYNGGFVYNMFLNKYDANGNLIWSKYQDPSWYTSWYLGSFGIGLTSDDSGNIYLAGAYGSNDLFLDNITITGGHAPKGFVAKLDSAGHYMWVLNAVQTDDLKHFSPTDIIRDDDNHILVSFFRGNLYSNIYFPDGSSVALDTLSNGNYIVTKLNMSDGSLNKIYSNGDSGLQINYCGMGIHNPNNTWAIPQQSYGYSPKMSLTKDGKLVLNGLYGPGLFPAESIAFGNFTLPVEQSGAGDGFVAILDTGSGTWLNAFRTYRIGNSWPGVSQYVPYFKSNCVDSAGNIYITGMYTTYANFPPFCMIGADTLHAVKGSFIAKFDSLGNLIWYVFNHNSFIYDMQMTPGNEIALLGYFDDMADFNSQGLPPQGASGSLKDIFIAYYDLNGDLQNSQVMRGNGWSWPGTFDLTSCGEMIFTVSSQHIVIGNDTLNAGNFRIALAHFSPDSSCTSFNIGGNFFYTAVGNTVYFYNSADSGATLYWDFGDGTTDTVANPFHTYPASTVYTATLTINLNGCERKVTKSINLNVISSISETPVSDYFQVAPNPFSEHLVLNYKSIPSSKTVIELDDVCLRRINTLFDGTLQARSGSITLPVPEHLENGIYFLKIISGKQTTLLKIIKM